MRRGPILALLGIGTIAGVIATAVAIFLPWLPPEASNERGRIDVLFWFPIAICIMIFAIVVAASGRHPTTTPTARRSTGTRGSRSSGRSSRPCS